MLSTFRSVKPGGNHHGAAGRPAAGAAVNMSGETEAKRGVYGRLFHKPCLNPQNVSETQEETEVLAVKKKMG